MSVEPTKTSEPSEAREERRRDPRYPVRLAVTLVTGQSSVTVYTEDISFRGLFLRTDTPPGLRQLLQLRIALGPDQPEVVTHAMAVHAIAPDASGNRVAGVGMQFYALDGEHRERWTRFIDQVREGRSAAGSSAPNPAATSPSVARPSRSATSPSVAPPNPASVSPSNVDEPEPIRRRWPRLDARFSVHVRSMVDLHTFTVRDVSRGGMFIRTTERLAVGARLRLEIAHPEIYPFQLEAVVRRVVSDGDCAGIGVEFVEFDPRTQDAIDRVLEAVEPDTPDPVFVSDYDPNLA